MTREVFEAKANVTNGAETTEVTFHYWFPKPSDKLAVIKSVVDSVVTEDDYYTPVLGLMFDFALMTYCTDVDIPLEEDKTSESQIDQIYDFFDGSTYVDVVRESLGTDVLSELVYGIQQDIEYRTGIHDNVVADSIANLLDTASEFIKEVRMDDMVKALESFQNIQNDFTPERVVQAVLDNEKKNQKNDNNKTHYNKSRSNYKKRPNNTKKPYHKKPYTGNKNTEKDKELTVLFDNATKSES